MSRLSLHRCGQVAVIVILALVSYIVITGRVHETILPLAVGRMARARLVREKWGGSSVAGMLTCFGVPPASGATSAGRLGRIVEPGRGETR